MWFMQEILCGSHRMHARKLLFGEVKGLCAPGPGSSLNDLALRECQNS